MTDWLAIIKKHHREIKRAFLVAFTDINKENLGRLEFLIDAHSTAEESKVYPQLSKHGMNDEQLEKEQTDAKIQIHYLVDHIDEPNIKSELRKLYKAVMLHALNHEEKNAFKKLHSKLSTRENDALGKAYLDVYEKYIS